MNRSEINRRQFSDRGQSWFSKRYACWANNHNGWSKMKKLNKKLFKKKFRRETAKEIEEELSELEDKKEIKIVYKQSSKKEFPKISEVGYFINLHGKADNGVTYYVDGKAMIQEEYGKYVEEKSEELSENIVACIIILSYLLLPIVLVALGGRL